MSNMLSLHDSVRPPDLHTKQRYVLFTLVYIVLYVTALVLVALTDHNPMGAKGNWQWFIPFIGLVATAGGWHNVGNSLQERAVYLGKQVLHWGALMLAIRLLYQSDVQNFMHAETDGFMIVYLVGLASLLAGIYLDWKMAVFGLFLIMSGVGIAFLDDNAMLLAISGGAAVSIVATSLIRLRLKDRSSGVPDKPRPPDPSSSANPETIAKS